MRPGQAKYWRLVFKMLVLSLSRIFPPQAWTSQLTAAGIVNPDRLGAKLDIRGSALAQYTCLLLSWPDLEPGPENDCAILLVAFNIN